MSTYEAKTHLSSLLQRVQDGEEVTITKHGKPVARLVPVEEPFDWQGWLDEARALRVSFGDKTFDVKALIEEGRRY